MANIIHYRNKCIGCGVCCELQPELWRMSKKDGKATLLRSTRKNVVYVLSFSRHVPERMQETVSACPVRVIKVG